MKKYVLLLCLVVGLTAPSVAQTDSLSLDKLYKMVQQLQQQQTAFNKLMEARKKDSLMIKELATSNTELQKTLSGQQKSYDEQMRILQDSIRSSASKLSGAMQTISAYKSKLDEQGNGMENMKMRMELKDELQYKHIKENIINITILYELMNEKLNALDAFRQLGNYQTLMQDLNNPANTKLGFSYNEKVIELLDEHITFDKKEKENSKILKFANVILSSPIVQGVTSFTPVLGTANSLFSFITGASMERKDITEEKLMKFKDGLERYTIYYVKLNEANGKFASRLNNYQEQNQALHEKLKDLTDRNVQDTKTDIRSKPGNDATVGDYLLNVFRYHNAQSVRDHFRDMELKATTNGKVNYGELLKNDKLQDMYKRTEDAILLFKDFEQLHNQYIKILDNNTDAVIGILNEAIELNLSKKSGKIKSEIDLLISEKKATVASVNRAINIIKLGETASKLSKFPPTI